MENRRQVINRMLSVRRVFSRVFTSGDRAILIGNISVTFITQVLSAGFSIGFSILISRTLGTSGQGKYALTLLLSSLLTQFLNLGISGANVYFISRKEITPKEALEDSLYLGFVLIVIGGTLGTLAVFLTKDNVFQGLPSFALIVSICLYAISLLRMYLLSILQSTQNFSSYNRVILASSGSTFLFAGIVTSLFGPSFVSITVSSLLGNVVSFFLCLFLVQKVIENKSGDVYLLKGLISSLLILSKSRVGRMHRSIRYGWKVAFSNIIASLNYRIDILLISYFLGIRAVGIYVVAVQIAEKLWFFSQSVSTVILPKLAAFYSSDDSQQAEKSPTLSICKFSLLLTLPAAVVTAVLAPKLVPLLFGSDFQPSIAVLLFLLPGTVLLSSSRILANDIAARGHPELNLYSSLVVLIVNIVLNVVLIKEWGVVGAAIATSIAYAVNAFIKLSVYANYHRFKEGRLFL